MINMNTELIIPTDKSIDLQHEHEDALVVAMRDIWINEEYLAKNLKNIIDNAVTETKKWDIIEDFVTKLSAVKAARKFMKDTPDVQIQIANIFQPWDNIL